MKNSYYKLTKKQTVEITLYTNGGNEQKYKKKSDNKCGNVKEEGNCSFTKSVQNTRKCTGQIEQWADKTEGQDKGACHIAFE